MQRLVALALSVKWDNIHAAIDWLWRESTHEGADAASGQQVFNNVCRTCHTTREGDNRLGPHLYKIIGRKAGSLPDYGYSTAMKGADLVWDEEKLERFIAVE